MELYIDVIFFVTWGMDTFLLWMAGRFIGLKRSRKRLFLSGFLVSCGACLWLCLFRRGGLLCALFLLSSGVLLAYAPKSGFLFLRLLGAALLSSFLLGGGATLLFTLTESQRMLGQGLVIAKLYPWQLLLWSVLFAYFLLKLGAGWIETHICRRREFCTVAVLWRGKCVEARTLIDTGNGLKQGDGRGIAVLELRAVLPLFTAAEGISLLSGNTAGLDSVPFASLGHPNGRLCGILAEQVTLFFGERSVCHQNIFLGISMESFTGSYEGLVPPCLLKEEGR